MLKHTTARSTTVRARPVTRREEPDDAPESARTRMMSIGRGLSAWLLVGLAALHGCVGANDEAAWSAGVSSNASTSSGSSASASSSAASSAASSASSSGASTSSSTSGSGGADGEVLEAVSFGAYTREQILPYVESGVVLDNGYAIWRLRYATDGREARAVITIPDATPPSGGWHVVVNNPGTSGLDDPCAVGESVAGVGLAGYFGARGIVGISVDYPGLGTTGSHPYLVTRVEGTASLDSLRAMVSFAGTQAIPLSGKFAVTGLSQGGHATLAAASLHAQYAPELDVRAFALVAPASVFLEQWSAGVGIAGVHQVYHAMAVYAFNAFYDPRSSATDLWTSSLAGRIDTLMETRCPFAVSGPTLVDELGTDPAMIFNSAFLATYSAGNVDGYPAVARGFRENRVVPFTQSAPVRIYQGTADDTVPAAGTQQLVNTLRAGGMTIDHVEVAGGGHTDVAFSFLAVAQLRTEEALTWLRGHLDP